MASMLARPAKVPAAVASTSYVRFFSAQPRSLPQPHRQGGCREAFTRPSSSLARGENGSRPTDSRSAEASGSAGAETTRPAEYFTSAPRLDTATDPHTNQPEPSPDFAPLEASVRHHPLLQRLEATLQPQAARRDPGAVWEAYTAIYTPSATAEGVPAQVQIRDHRRVLGTLGIAIKLANQTRSRRKATPPSARDVPMLSSRARWTSSIRGAIRRSATLPLWQSRAYLDRATFVLQSLRETSAATQGTPPEQLGPATSDFNRMLSVAESQGDLGLADAVWALMTHSGTVRPDMHTYEWTVLTITSTLRRSRDEYPPDAQASGAASRESHEAAIRSARLIRQMSEAGLQPSVLMLKHLATMMRKGGSLRGIVALLKVGFGLELDNLDATLSERVYRHMGPALLNTVITILGQRLGVSEMLAFFETVRQPLPRSWSDTNDKSLLQSNGDAPASQAGGGGLGVMFGDLFYNDPKALSGGGEDASDGSGPATAAVSSHELNSSDRPYGVTPNLTTYRVLLSNCLLNDPIAAAQAAETLPHAEVEARKKGQYGVIARYLVDEALQQYRRQLLTNAQHLGLAFEEGSQRVVPIAGFSESPFYDPPTVVPQFSLFYSLFRRGSRTRSRRHLDWLLERVQGALSLMAMEIDMLGAACEMWTAKAASAPAVSKDNDQSSTSPVFASQESAFSELAARLEGQRTFVFGTLEDLQINLVERIGPRAEAVGDRLTRLRRAEREKRENVAEASREREQRRQQRVESREEEARKPRDWEADEADQTAVPVREDSTIQGGRLGGNLA